MAPLFAWGKGLFVRSRKAASNAASCQTPPGGPTGQTCRFRPVVEELENRVVPNAPGTGWTLNWSDEFNGTSVDYTKWADYLPWNSSVTGDNRYHGGDYANYMVNHDTVVNGQTLTSNISVSGGQLHLKTQKVAPFTVGSKTFQYTGAMLTTGRGAIYRNWSSGYFEIRARLPQGAGNWPAFWMTNGWLPESDIMEFWPGHRNHQGLYGMDNAWHDRNDWSGSLPSPNWHTFGMEWGPGYQKYYIDDQLRYSTSGSFVPGSANPMYLLLNSSVANSQSGSYSNANDNTLDVDYVRVYSYTATSGPAIANPGFESGTTGWALSGSAAVVNYNQRTGLKQLRMDGGTGYAQQVITGLTPNTTYTLSGRDRVSSGATVARIGVKNYGGAEVWADNSGTGYTRKSVTFTTGPTSTQATIYVSKPVSGNAAEFDDLVLSEATVLNPIADARTPVNTPASVTVTASQGSAGGFWSFTAASSNQALVADGGFAYSGSGSSRTLTITPVAGETGTTTITVTATDPLGTVSTRTFDFTVTEYLAWYLADESSGSSLADNSGHNRTASLCGASDFGTGVSGNALTLGGGYARLPAGIVSRATDFTFAAWVRLDSLDTWSRVFDFGTGTGVNMFLTPRAGGTDLPRFAITTSGGSDEQRIDGNTAVAVGVWTHVAVTLSGGTGTLYLNGVAVGSNTAMTLTPASLGSTNRNYIGRSQYSGDPALQAGIDDIRLYGTALSAGDIYHLWEAWAAPPVLAPIDDQAMPATQDVLTVPLSATDPNGDRLTFSVAAQSLAYVLDQQLGLYSAGDYYENYLGLGERWMAGGDAWYFVTPGGELYREDGTPVGNVGASYWADPTLLHDAQPDQPRAALSISEDLLAIDREDGFLGSLVVWVTVSDGVLTDTRAFTVTVTSG